MFYIYLVTNKVNGKVYVGKTSRSVAERWENHVKASRSKRAGYFWRAIRRHGRDAFSVDCIAQTEHEKHANWLESLYIGVSKSYLPEIGYNSTMGGDGVPLTSAARLAHREKMASKEVRQRMSAVKKGEKNPGFGKRGEENPRFGMRHSDATKQRISRVKSRPLDLEAMRSLRETGSTYQKLSDLFSVSIGTVYRRLNVTQY